MALTATEKLHLDLADTEARRTLAVRKLRNIERLMEDGLHAIQNGRYEVAEEYMDRAHTLAREALAGQ